MSLTIGDVLDVRHPGRPAFSPDGRYIGFLWNQNGPVPLYAADGQQLLQVSAGKEPVTGFAWDGVSVLYVQEGKVYRAVPGEQPEVAIDPGQPVSSLRVSPHGTVFVSGDAVWVLGAGSLRRVRLGEGASLPAAPWGPEGALLVNYREDGKRYVAVVAPDGSLAWRTESGGRWRGGAVGWAGRRAIYLETPDGRRKRRLMATDPTEVLLYEEDPAGLGSPPGPAIAPDGTAIAVHLAPNGWDNLHVLELATGELKRLSNGEWEDFGHSADPPAWSPDSRRLAFASNRGAPAERQVYVTGRDGSETRAVTALRGTSCDAVWAPDGSRLAFLHCGLEEACDLWLEDAGGVRRLTDSLPAAFAQTRQVVPEEVRYPSRYDGAPVPAYLWRPAAFDPERRYPALVWIHGGPMRQMRLGWQPLHSYMLFYAFHQYLAQRGYVALWVNYRGGIGYGRAFERGARAVPRGQGTVDCGDVVGGAAYLRGLPFVDPERVGIWGLSWGGYLTLSALTRHPGTFAVGVNLAGMWDMELERPRDPQAYSPKERGADLRDPLYNFQGTADRNVSFKQMDAIVKDATRLHLPFWTEYYPGEVHVFEHRENWEDAFAKIESAFARHLGPRG